MASHKRDLGQELYFHEVGVASVVNQLILDALFSGGTNYPNGRIYITNYTDDDGCYRIDLWVQISYTSLSIFLKTWKLPSATINYKSWQNYYKKIKRLLKYYSSIMPEGLGVKLDRSFFTKIKL